MFAIIETGAKQYKVEKGTTFHVEKLDVAEGATVKLDKVLLVSDGETTDIGTPLIIGAEVTAKVVEHGRGDKIIVFKMKAKKRYQKKQRHRQDYTLLEITEIKQGGAKAPKAVKADKADKAVKDTAEKVEKKKED